MLKAKTDLHEGRVYTTSYVAYGRLHSLPRAGMANHLNQPGRPFLPVVSATLVRGGVESPPPRRDPKRAIEYLAVQKKEILWILGGSPTTNLMRGSNARRVALLFHDHCLRGYLEMPHNARSTDFLNHWVESGPFQHLDEVELLLVRNGQILRNSTPMETFGFVTVNLANVVAAYELAPEGRRNGSKPAVPARVR